MAPQTNTINVYTVADLPTAPALGTPALAIVNDASLPSLGAVPTGGGLVTALVWFNGSVWHIVAL